MKPTAVLVRLSAALVGLLLIALVIWPLGKLWPSPPLQSLFPNSQLVLAADGSLLRLTTAADEQYRAWVPLSAINNNLVEAMLAQEDRWFYYHLGVNPVSLVRGAFATYTGGARQGGSTLSMQLVRLLNRSSTRTPWAKTKQIAQTLWLEWRYSKTEILEAYLNFAPFGGNIQGVEAAAWLYFNKPASQISTLEAAILAVTPQQPNLRPRHAASTHAAVVRLLTRWQAQAPERQDLNIHPVAQAYFPKPVFLAPHAVDYLLALQPHNPKILSTLEPNLQFFLEQQLQLNQPSLQRYGIQNAAAVLVHWPSQSLVAMVGSLDYFNKANSGQVNGTLAKRSPGSTLKPLVYAAALDQGLIHPLSILKDTPQNFGNYLPENFDGGFAGPISATLALNRSRNIPVVALAEALNPEQDLYSLLKSTQVQPLASRNHYGLSLVLGGAEISMLELARLYSLLANQGIDTPLRFTKPATHTLNKTLLSPAASYLTLDMLAQNPAPNISPQALQHPWFTAWKTGTSWSLRDAWTAGVVGSYVLIVWAGNFDGSSNQDLVGIKTAAPLWWRIADGLPRITAQPEQLRPVPSNLQKVDFCAASGDLPNSLCPKVEQGWFITGVSPIKVSQLHQKVWVNKKTGLAVCPPYTHQHEQRVYEFWPSDLASMFQQAGLNNLAPPSIDCSTKLSIQEANKPQILLPYANINFMLNAKGVGVENKLALQAAAEARVKTLYWQADNQLLGTSKPNRVLYWQPTTLGRKLITVTDDQGRSASRWITIDEL